MIYDIMYMYNCAYIYYPFWHASVRPIPCMHTILEPDRRGLVADRPRTLHH